MAKAISGEINQKIVDEYSTGQISQAKLALKLGVSKIHVFRVLKRSRCSNLQDQQDLAVLENLTKPDIEAEKCRI